MAAWRSSPAAPACWERSSAGHLRDAGATVAVADLDAEKAEAVAARLRAAGGQATGLALDVTRPESVKKVVDRRPE